MLNNFFDTDEQTVINQTTNNENLSTLSKDDLLIKIDFVLVVTTDEAVLNLYNGLKNKISSLTNDEWYQIRDLLPFAVPYSENDTAVFEDEVQN